MRDLHEDYLRSGLFGIQDGLVSTTGVVVAAASTGNRARFIAFGVSNADTAAAIFRLYDGTAAAGTLRATIALAAGAGWYQIIDGAGRSVFPKSWFTSGNAIECSIAASGDVRVFGEVVREA